MNYDTPLTEVARFLPTSAAEILTRYPIPIQSAVLENVRNVLVMWEANSVHLDPVQLEGVLNGLVLTLAGTLGPVTAAIAQLSQDLREAVALNERYHGMLQGEGRL